MTHAESSIPLPRLSAAQDALLRVAFEELRRTRRPVPQDLLSGHALLSAVDVEAELDLLGAAGRVTCNAEHAVSGALGLTVEPTRHVLDLGGAPWHTWCVIDALGILGALRETGSVRSPSPGSGTVVEVRFTDGRISGGDLDSVVFVPDYRTGASVLRTWCPAVNFFIDAASCRRWASTHSVAGRPVALAEAATAAARRWYDRLAG